MIVFSMTPEIAELFYTLCKDYDINTEEERTKLLLLMAQEQIPMTVSYTKRSKQKYMKDLAREFKIMEIKGEKDNEENNGC